MLVKKHPDIAQELLASFAQPALEEDHTKISVYFTLFCQEMGINEEEYTGPLYKSSKVDYRRLFVAALMHLYCPHVYHQPIEEINLSKKGFVIGLAETLQYHESHVSAMIREVITWEKGYEEFKERVQVVVEKLKAAA